MPVTILTDSTSDILPHQAQAMGVQLIPMQLSIDGQVYHENIDITHEEFFQKLSKAHTLPKTSQLTPGDFLPCFQQAQFQGNSLVCILLAGKLSGTVQSALIAKELCGYDDIHIVDSTQATMGIRILVELACLLRDQGRSAREIAAELTRSTHRVRLVAMLDTLEYLHRGGRLPRAAAVAGTLLKVKPLVGLHDGALSVLGKGMGVRDGLRNLMKLLGDDLRADPRLPILLGYTAEHTICDQLKALVEEKYHPAKLQIHSVGAVIGTHVGPGGTVICYLEQA